MVKLEAAQTLTALRVRHADHRREATKTAFFATLLYAVLASPFAGIVLTTVGYGIRNDGLGTAGLIMFVGGILVMAGACLLHGLSR